MSNSLIIGLIFSWLHLLPLLAGFCVVLLVAWMSVMRERKINLKRLMTVSTTMKPELHFWNHQKKETGIDETMKGRTKYAPVWFAMGMVCLLAYIATKPFPPPIATEHNVWVMWKLADGDWYMRSDEEGFFAYRPCPDFPVEDMFSKAKGFVAPLAKWEERGSCKSIRATGLGFWWRDKDGNYTKFDLPIPKFPKGS